MKKPDCFNTRRSIDGFASRSWLALVICGAGAIAGCGESNLNATGYTVTTEAVYYAGEPLETADPTSFRVLAADRDVAADDYHVYSRNQILSHIERKSFAVLDAQAFYMRDAEHVFYLQPGAAIAGADPASFTRLSVGDRGSEFWRDVRSVYIWGRRIAGADPRTFTALTGQSYARDQDRIYNGDHVLRQADAATFEVLFEDARGRPTYARDRDQVFYNEQIVQGADPATFQVLAMSEFARDADHLYYRGVANFAALDLDNLRLGQWFVRDAARVYLVPHDPENTAPLFPDANPRALATLGEDGKSGYASDGVHVYYYNGWRNQVELLKAADPKTFQVVKTDFRGDLQARDDNARYFNEKRIE